MNRVNDSRTECTTSSILPDTRESMPLLANPEWHYASVLNVIADGVLPSIRYLRGMEVEEAIREHPFESIAPDSIKTILAIRQQSIEAEAHGEFHPPYRVEVQQYRKDGSLVCVEMQNQTMTDGSGNVIGYVGVSRNITERKQSEVRLQYVSTHDSLTGLFNRGWFEERL